MSTESNTRTGQVAATPEGGPKDEGAPAAAPGAGQVQVTPEGGPLTPPTMRDHMQGPILGLDDVPASGISTAPPPAPAASREEAAFMAGPDAARGPQDVAPTRTRQDEDELKKWPPYSGKPVSEVRWDALKYAAPVVSQAEKLAISAIDLSGRGLSRLARYLESRRAERNAADGPETDENR